MPPPRSILVVDDSAEIRDVWLRVLTKAGFTVIEAADGAEGVRKARANHPDLVLMDVSMPVLDGISAVRELKSDHATAMIPVVVVSGDVLGELRARAAGVTAFLSKPVRAPDLLAAVTRALDDAP
jgi:two-component system, chemotaxis family, chemotaxis protein CheY